MRLVAFSAGVVALAACAAPGFAMESPAPQSAIANPWRVERQPPVTVSDLLTRLDRDARFESGDRALAGGEGWIGYDPARNVSSTWAASNRDIWYEGQAYSDRLRLRTEGRIRRADGSPLPPGPLDPAAYDAEHYDLTYTRGWTETLGQTENGLDVTLSPHVGVGVGSRGDVTEAGATLRIGRDLDRLAPDGGDAFGERARWYVYAAGSGRAVGYNWARNRDGDYVRSGVSHDSGAFLGDASLGVALRRGPVHSSIGLVYREIEAEGLRAGNGVDTDVSEGLLAFQLSIKPE
ncbi:lipid A-modifier LpxR family protein [Brevundimonas sp.]|uniref:lipid A-modifier LpxR family protein n=1 Tax=Brevundimonas sp. TaxID=1871086 RepID=UPI002D6F6598|nr:lipid A-modifier LpxR family protein [Brevundimonas sp.]HYD26478.1 lipid A-modifier LpxR family protein [Brevundimonas sp.]